MEGDVGRDVFANRENTMKYKFFLHCAQTQRILLIPYNRCGYSSTVLRSHTACEYRILDVRGLAFPCAPKNRSLQPQICPPEHYYREMPITHNPADCSKNGWRQYLFWGWDCLQIQINKAIPHSLIPLPFARLSGINSILEVVWWPQDNLQGRKHPAIFKKPVRTAISFVVIEYIFRQFPCDFELADVDEVAPVL